MISNIIIIYYIYQFGCRILKMVDPKEQNLWPRIYILKGNFFEKSFDDLQFVKKCHNRTFKVNF